MKALLLLPLLIVAAAPRDAARPSGPIDGLPLDVLPKQELPATGCAAFLWTGAQTRTLVAMVVAQPAHLRLMLDGAIVDLPRTAQSGAGGFGLTEAAEYAVPGTHATLDFTIETRGDMVKGGVIPQGSLRLDRDGKDGLVVPITGLVGCAG